MQLYLAYLSTNYVIGYKKNKISFYEYAKSISNLIIPILYIYPCPPMLLGIKGLLLVRPTAVVWVYL
jgi:hypothetical protein